MSGFSRKYNQCAPGSIILHNHVIILELLVKSTENNAFISPISGDPTADRLGLPGMNMEVEPTNGFPEAVFCKTIQLVLYEF